MEEVKEYFRQNYPYVEFNLSKKDVESFLSQPYLKGFSFEAKMNFMYDYILSQGLGDVQE